MGQIIMRIWDLREFCVRVNLASPIQQVPVPIWCVITPIQGLPNLIRQVVPLNSHIRSYSPHRSHLYRPSLSLLSITLPSSQNTKLSHHCLSLNAMIMRWHWVQANTMYSIHRVQHQHIPKIACHPFILMITSWPLNVASASGVPSYTIDCHQPARQESSKIKSPCHIPIFASQLTDE